MTAPDPKIRTWTILELLRWTTQHFAERDIETPRLDRLAHEGARFTSFYTQVSCSPTRSLLMTGVDNPLNGLGTTAEDPLPPQDGVPGYGGYLHDEVVTVATLLGNAGYRT